MAIKTKKEKTMQKHQYHLVDPSPWPILTAFSLLTLALGGVMFMHEWPFGMVVLPAGVIFTGFFAYVWWRDVIKEGIKDKAHTKPVRQGLRIAMALFILSEVMFFFVFFWSFFKYRLFPEGILEGLWVVAEGAWPPEGIVTFDPWTIPFLNTIILLLSGNAVTWAHYALEEGKKEEMISALGYTIILGLLFTAFQVYEYHHAAFAFTDGIYASNFYMATGFHGMHVMLGTIFLIVCYFRAKRGHFDKGKGHLGFEFAAWYWHFVDVVWLFLFVFVYVLGG